MRNLIYLIVRYSAFILFILLECVSFYLIINYNRSQKEIWTHSSNLLSGNINKRLENIEGYFNLHTLNDSLVSSNAALLEKIINYRVTSQNNAFQEFEKSDSLQHYSLIPVRVCGKTLNLRNNYFTLCKGKKDGIAPGMGVMSDNGIVGIVKSVSQHFSTVMLILNSQCRVSAKIKANNYPGTVVWQNDDPSLINMLEVPRHAQVEIGDTILSSGFSISFPPDTYIGKISDFKVSPGNSDYSIIIEMDQDLPNLDFVYVIDYYFKDEKEELLQAQNE